MSQLLQQDDRIFVAGSRGMAGSAICRALVRKGFGNPDLGGQLLAPVREDLDLLSQRAVESWMIQNKPTVVVLAAAKVGGIYANNTYPADFLLENLKIQNNVIESSFGADVRRLLFLGSSCIYPKLADQPIREDALLTGLLEPTNESYAIAKIAGIKLCEALRLQHGFDAISLMPTNLYGPGDNYHPKNSHVLPALIRRFHEASQSGARTVTCWGTGSPMREFLHVDDLGDACVFALQHWSALADDAPLDDSGKPLAFLNVGTGVALTIKELAIAVAKATGFTGSIQWDTSKPDGTPKKQLDVSRMQSLGWHASIPLPEGLEQTVNLFRNHSEQDLVRL